MEKKQQTIKWLNIFLLIINISAFATFLYMNQSQKSETTEAFNSDEYLKEVLQLTDKQYEAIMELDQKVFRNYQVLIDIQCETNFELVKELSSENPSEDELKRLTDKIGKYHTAVKRQTVTHFQNIKSVCDDNQKLLLDKLLLEMMEAGDQCEYCNKASCSRRNQLDKK
jgi:arsenate reductase-like glutaredoxin family protein